ncbi:hypothetical protein LJB42_001481 [Komagataella kurtzmanii]|nr:hypothetical protein LJB42_001481 [Komagataella kurtzmanii]
MPSVKIDCSQLHKILSNPEYPQDSVIATPHGLVVVEIQGVLNLPTETTSKLNKESSDSKTIIEDNLSGVLPDELSQQEKGQADRMAIKIGELQFSEGSDQVTLLINNTQRLNGTVEKLNPPLGLLKFTNSVHESRKQVHLIDIIEKKCVFKTRALPV